jgi:ABC-type lipoprotein release transport system permease subunit
MPSEHGLLEENREKMFRYAFKRVARGYKLFLALTIGIIIATTFVSSLVISADVQTSMVLENALEGLDYDARIDANNVTWTSTQWNEVQTIIDDLPEVSQTDRYAKIHYTYNITSRQSFDIVGIEQPSTIWDSFEWINGTTSLGPNETYVVASSVNASALSLGQTIEVPLTLLTTNPPYFSQVVVNLTIAGFIDIPLSTARLLNPPTYLNLGFIQIELGNWQQYDLIVTDWNQTIQPIVNWYSGQENITRIQMQTGFFCQLNRGLLVNPYDVGGSSSSIANALAKVEDRTAAYNTRIVNLVSSTLGLLSLASTVLVLGFVALAVPVVFMSWYSSTMLSEVSYNLRRREFGLLQTKGFGPDTIKRMLLIEGLIIGLVGGILGLITGAFVAQFVAGASLSITLRILTGNLVNDTVIVVFGLILAYWSVRGPASRASRLDPLDSLKQYILVEEQREYRNLLPRIALILGTYKIVVWMLGISIQTLLSSALNTSFVLLIAVAIWSPIDQFLNFAGPILFLYGLTKILIRGSEKFQEGIMRAGRRFFGPFGTLSTRNLKRNPSRNAAFVFVLSLIVSYGVFSVGGLFSEQDRISRTNMYDVGADVSAVYGPGENMTSIEQTIAGIEGVQSEALEYQISLTTTRGSLPVRGITPEDWLSTAFYEKTWFTGQPLDDMLSNFTGEKIILSISVARQLELRLGNYVTVRGPVSGTVYQLEVVGFIGYASPFESILGQFAFGGSYPSYVPADFLVDTGIVDYADSHVLIDTQSNVNGTLVEEEITTLLPQTLETDSVTSRLAQYDQTSYEAAASRARTLGIYFAAVLAILGTGLVVGLTLKEKEYETTLLGVRGFTRSQTMKVLIGEVMVMVLFALILGSLTGFIELFGDISNTSENLQSLVRPRIVLTLPSVLGMLGIVMCILVSSMIPLILSTRFTEEKVDILRE